MDFDCTYDSDDKSLGELVVEAVAAEEGVRPTDIDPPLYEIVDPDALDSLFRSTLCAPRNDGCISFSYCDYVVTVHGSGRIEVQPCPVATEVSAKSRTGFCTVDPTDRSSTSSRYD